MSEPVRTTRQAGTHAAGTPDRASGATGWRGTLGALAGPDGVEFRVWAPTTGAVEVVVEREGLAAESRALVRASDGLFSCTWPDLATGTLYRYRLDGDGPLPDPASRSQPHGVHGPSAVVDPAYAWSDQPWTGLPLESLVIYELHVGTFSAAGTFAGVTEHLPDLQELGITAVELMPVADFPGSRNWGYDGVAPFAPARCYGPPEDLRRLVDTAHGLGLAVILDVVYNHLGPDGAYLSRFSPYYFTDRHPSPWGTGIDPDGPHRARVRQYFIENALHWVHEYHMDGVRLDATHAITDESPRHLLAELTAAVKESAPRRHVHVIAEDDRNLAHLVARRADGGFGLDAVWADDFHHQMRRHLAGDADGYFRDYTGSTADLATTLGRGWFYTGQHSVHSGAARGTDPSGIPLARFVVCLQNHDQIGNRALGDRLHHTVDDAAFRAASVVLLTAPETPLLFMGQEWAASSPFQYFTDHEEPLGRLVSEGRHREFATFTAFATDGPHTIPDPQARATFDASRLRWDERLAEPHASMRRLHHALLAFRRTHLRSRAADEVPTPAGGDAGHADGTTQTADRVAGPAVDVVVVALDASTLGLRRTRADGGHVLVVARLDGRGMVTLAPPLLPTGAPAWTCHLTSEDDGFAVAPARPTVSGPAHAPTIQFEGPAAVILTSGSPRDAADGGGA
ncbi:MAG: malto-oligosyltrehalose trehalohydrolase [Vicinamibacterales bacterium]